MNYLLQYVTVFQLLLSVKQYGFIIEEQLSCRGIQVPYETIWSWNIKVASHFRDVIEKQEREPKDKWHLDEMNVKVNREKLIL